VPDLAPWFVTKGRAAVAGLPAVGLLFVMRRPLPPRDIWPDLVLGAAALVVGFPGLVALAIQTLPASQGGLVLAGRAASRLKPAA
jgi:drug/metabolite transporter (DMT)-like permease